MSQSLYSFTDVVLHLNGAYNAVVSALQRANVIDRLMDDGSDEPLDSLYSEIAILARTIAYAGEEAQCAAQDIADSLANREE